LPSHISSVSSINRGGAAPSWHRRGGISVMAASHIMLAVASKRGGVSRNQAYVLWRMAHQ